MDITFNSWVISFLQNNWLSVPTLVLFLFPFFPPTWFGYSKQRYDSTIKSWIPAEKLSLFRVLLHLFLTTLSEIPIQFISYFQFKETISLLIFLVIGFDLFYRHSISREAVTLVGIGLLALYLEQLILNAKKIILFWKLLEWERKDDIVQQLPNMAPNVKTKSKKS